MAIGAIIGGALGAAELGYNIFQQAKTWKREDTAYTRSINDMRSAGVNPQLFTGSAAPTGQPFRAGNPMEKAMMGAQLESSLADVGKKRAETSLLEAQTHTENVKRNHMEIMNPMEQSIKAADEWISSNTKSERMLLVDLTLQLKKDQQFLNEWKKNIAEKIGTSIAEFDLRIRSVQADVEEKFGMERAEAEIAAMLISAAIAEQSARYYGEAGLPPNYKPSGIVGNLMSIYSFIRRLGR